MKTIRKMMALMIAVVMCMSMMSMVAFADNPTSGTITVDPNYENQTYTLYKLFDAHITWNDNGTVRAITYTLPEGKENLGDGTAWFHINDNGFVEANDRLDTDWAKDAAAIAWAESFGTQVGDSIKANSDNDANVKWENLDWGYYFVKTTLGSFIGIDSTQPNATIQDKNEKPSIDKEITGVNSNNEGTSNFGAGNDGNDASNDINEKATAQVGDTISYKLTVAVKPGAKNYVITDTLTNLKLDATTLKVDDVLYSSSTKVDNATSGATTTADSSFQITLKQSWLDTVEEATTVTITYDAVLQDSAVIGENGNPNDVTLTWGDNPTDNKDEDKANVYSAQLNLLKTDGNSAALKGATFVLKNKAGKYYKVVDGAVTWVDSVDAADTRVTNASGKFDTPFSMLGNGTYTFQETVTPDGFNKIDDKDPSLTVKISASDYTDANLKQDPATTVVNNAGTELPSTGGIGTTIFYIVGAILVLGAGILLVTRRRMNAQ